MPPTDNAVATRTPEQIFAAKVSATANKQLQAILGTDAGKRAAHSITMGMLGAMRVARDPSAFLKVTEASIADCVATSYETSLHPGGPNPTVYLVPQAPRKGAQPELQWRITHRGLSILGDRAGFSILAVPVSTTDRLKVSFGEAVEHEADPSAWPSSLDELLGCILVVKRIDSGVTICRPWMPRAAILRRRAVSRDGAVWGEWPVEQAQKTVIKWGFARGYIPLDSPELRSAMSADDRDAYVIDARAESLGVVHDAATQSRGNARQKLQLSEGLPAGNAPVPQQDEEGEREYAPSGEPTDAERAAIEAAERQEAAKGQQGQPDDEGMS